MRNILLLIYLFLIHLPAFGQEYLLDIQNLTSENGLANMHTYSTFKDSKGYLWIGTKYGLNRYDGYEFKLFTHEENGLYSNDLIQRIEEDTEGNLWLFYMQPGADFATISIDVFNPISKKAVPIQEYLTKDLPFDIEKISHTKIKGNHHQIWIYDSEGQLFFYKDKEFKKIFENSGKSIQTITVTEKGIWVGSENELIHLNLEGEILERNQLPEPIYQIWQTDSTVWLHTVKKSYYDSIYFTVDYTIWKKAFQDTNFTKFPFAEDDLFKASQGGYLHRAQDGLWYCGNEKTNDRIPKIKVYKPDGKEIFDLEKELSINSPIQSNGLQETGEDLWLTGNVGLIQVKITKNPFQIIHTKEKMSDTRGITEDELGNIYFLNGSIFKYNPTNGNSRKLTKETGTYDLTYRDSSLYASLYTADFSRLTYDLRTGIESYSPIWTGYSRIFCSTKIDESEIYLIGGMKGLSYFNFNENTGLPFQEYNEFEELKNFAVYDFHKDKSGIWLATENGIYLFKKGKGITHHFSSETGDLPFNHIKHISESSEGIFWLATSGGGVIRWQANLHDDKPSQYRQFTTVNGLSNDYTYAVYPDNYGSLWIPSDKGLMQMNVDDFSVKTYLTEDGLPHNEFNTSSHYRAKDGTFYFGGLGGLISFHPKNFSKKKDFNTPLRLTSFKLWEDGKAQMTNKTDDFQVERLIEIRPGDKVFELEFALLDFDEPKNHRYSYLIEGFDKREQLLKENYLRITNLPYGNYTLKIKGRNITKGWSEQELSIPINILKPFYLQWWFISAMLLAGISLIYIYFHRRERRLRLESERLEIEVKNRTKTIFKQTEELKELDKAKTRFFSNITHELRTPLTLILGPSMQMAQNEAVPIAQRKKSWNISKNAQHLLSLINQMLDLSKIEGGQMKIEISKGDIVSFIREVTEQFTPMVDKKHQKLHFITSETVWETHFDRNKLNKILFNLLSNALKFTEEGGIVNVFLDKVNEDTILIKVEDNGIGIKPEQLDRVFDRFYQADGTTTRTNEGTGIGLSLVKELVDLLEGNIDISSKLGEGTKFKISLPVLEITKGQIFSKKEQNLLAPTLILPALSTAEPNLAHSLENPIWQHSKLDLLIIEDNEGIHDYIRSCIDTEKYNIITAYNGEEGIQKAFELIPDLIISDIMMPIKDGFDVITAVRNHLPTSHIPLILLTAKSSLENRLQGLKRGADAYLTKPFSPRELSLRIDKLIEIRQILHSRYRNGAEFPNEDLYHKEDAFVKKIRTYIIENIERTDLNGDIIGKHFGYSRMHIYRKLKALTNQSISEMIKEIRLRKAMELLQDKSNDLNITEVTYKTGFSSISYFSKTFKSFYGKAPSDV